MYYRFIFLRVVLYFDAGKLARASQNSNNEERYLTILHNKSLALKVGKNRQRVADLCVTSAWQISAPKLVKPVLYCAITKCTISNRTTSWNICTRFVRFLQNKQ